MFQGHNMGKKVICWEANVSPHPHVVAKLILFELPALSLHFHVMA